MRFGALLELLNRPEGVPSLNWTRDSGRAALTSSPGRPTLPTARTEFYEHS